MVSKHTTVNVTEFMAGYVYRAVPDCEQLCTPSQISSVVKRERKARSVSGQASLVPILI